MKQKTIEQKLGDLIRRMNSPFENEAIASALALRRALFAAGRDFHELAQLVENGSNGGGQLSETEMKRIFDAGHEVGFEAGFEAGLKEGESRHPIITFRDVGDAYSMAQFCWERIERLPRQHRGFIEGMVELAGESELTPKQHAYLKSLYRQLGGK